MAVVFDFQFLFLSSDVNAVNETGMTPFMHYCNEHHKQRIAVDEEVLDLLLSNGASVNQKVCNFVVVIFRIKMGALASPLPAVSWITI